MASRSKTVRGLITLLRPYQWVKNGFVLAPLLFSGKFLDAGSLHRALFAMGLFCLASSAAYIVNDLHDVEQDRRHPKKSQSRPLASGILSPRMAVAMLPPLYVALICSWFVAPKVTLVLAGYLLLNLAYTYVLKDQPVVDIFAVAIGFVLRVFAGAVAIAVPVSGWMFVTVLCLALYMAAVKRRGELSRSGTQGRKVLEKYPLALIDRCAQMSATGALVFYGLFVISVRPQMLMTVPLVAFGILRYWYVEGEDESPADDLLADRQLLLTVGIWIGLCAWALWPAAH